MLENMGYIIELTARHHYQGHMSVWRGGNCSHFFRLTQGKNLESKHTPYTSQFRGSIPCTGQTWRGWISVLVCQRRTNHASLGALYTMARYSLCLAQTPPGAKKVARGRRVNKGHFCVRVSCCFLCLSPGGTSVTNSLECPAAEKRMIMSMDTSQMVRTC